MRIEDSDDHASQMDVKAIPEGFSFQMSSTTRENLSEYASLTYISVIVSKEDARELIDHLQEELSK